MAKTVTDGFVLAVLNYKQFARISEAFPAHYSHLTWATYGLQDLASR